jgi:uncharacterized protein YabE (DUF348 family)
MVRMSVRSWVVVGSLALVWACQSPPASGAIIVDRGQVLEVRSGSRVPATLLQLAGIELGPTDQVLNRGYQIDPVAPIPGGQMIYIQIRRPAPILLNGDPVQTTSRTVGEALADAGIELRIADVIEPSPESPASAGLIVQHQPSRTVIISVDGQDIEIAVANQGIGSALSQAGIPIVGLDHAIPAESDVIPQDGQFRIARVRETVSLVQEPIPFGSESQYSDALELGIEQVLQPGLPGLSVTRTRVKFEDNVEVSRLSESDVVARPPQDRLVLRGTKIVDKTTTVDGVSLSYWYTMQMYATVYSPCNSGTADGSCSTGTASGLRAGKGVVAVDPGLFAVLNGQRLYIPGYGPAVIGDVGGGYIVEQNLGISRYKWIDLGFDDNNLQDMTGWITVYFLSPAPAAIPDVLK